MTSSDLHSPPPAQHTIASAAPLRVGRATRLEAWRNAAGYAATVLAVLAAMTVALELWRADLRVPFVYAGDNLMGQMFIQNILESGWALDGPRLGAPGGQALYDFPLPDILHIALLKLFGYLFHDSGLILNLHYLLGFPLTALAAYFVLRRFRLNRTTALTAAVLYACLPYHYTRMMGHLFLASYFLLPPMIWLLVRIYLGRYPLIRSDADGKPRWRFLSAEAGGAALLCVLTGLAGVYYAFFSCFFLLAVGIKAAFRERRWTPLIVASLLAALISAAVVAALTPHFIYEARHGANVGVTVRLPGESDSYALSIVEMLTPIEGHRLGLFRWLRDRSLAPPRRSTEAARFVPLGAAASLGFLYLLGRFLWRRRDKAERTADALAYLNVVALLLGTVGGLGACFNLYATPMIRCYDRLSVFITFFALTGLFLLLQRWIDRFGRSAWTRVAGLGGLLAILVLGLADQSSPLFPAAYAESKREYQSDEDFGRRMEAALPPGSMVYEMPNVRFPEAGKLIHAAADYELIRPYFHTRTLRFSTGAMINRAVSDWLARTADKPLAATLEALALAGFRGVYLDRAGYADSGAAVEAELTRLLGGAPFVSLSGRQSFFDMTSYVNGLRAYYGSEEWEAKSEAGAHPLELEWTGAYGEDKYPNQEMWRWCQSKAQLHLRNNLNRPRRVVLKMDSRRRTGESEPAGDQWGLMSPRVVADLGGTAARTGTYRAAGRSSALVCLQRPGASFPQTILVNSSFALGILSIKSTGNNVTSQ